MLIHPQSEMLAEPNLLVPGKKPVGPVKPNRGHPLCPHIFFICRSRDGSDLYDIVQNRHYAKDSSGIMEPDCYYHPDKVGNVGPVPIPAGGKGTMLCKHLALGSYSDDLCMLGYSSSGGCVQDCRYSKAGANNYRFYARISYGSDLELTGSTAFSSQAQLSQWRTYTAQWGDGTIRLFLDCADDGNGSVTLGTGAYNMLFFEGEARYEYLAWFTRILSKAELFSFITDPYQWLVPA